jgi:D-serine deaminase-like pyridoxal phosphate-dependent protein
MVSSPAGLRPTHLETPALLVDLEAMEQNLQTMALFFRGQSAKLRPHFKNHRVLELAARQVEHGAVGITCARLWQAERLVNAGIRNVLIANEVVGEAPLRRFVELSAEAPVLVAVDNATVVADMARLARNRGKDLNLLVDVDLGLKRCGVQPGQAAVSLAQAVVQQGLRFRGIMGYEGHLQPLMPGPEKQRIVKEAMKALVATKNQIEAVGIPVDIISCGGTGDYAIAGSFPGVTENQAGSYLLMDSWYAPYAPDFKPTLSVLATVISKTAGERIVVDAGVKAISGERGLPSVKGVAGLKLKALHAEHAPIEIVDSAVQVEVGDKIEISVHYHDGTIQLHHRMHGIRQGKVERIFSIEHFRSNVDSETKCDSKAK